MSRLRGLSLWPKTGAVSQLPISCQLTVCVPVVDIMVTLVPVGVA